MKFFKSLPLLILSLVLIIFAVANRQSVNLSLWPFPAEIPDVPLFFVFFGGIFVGMALAGLITAYRGVRHFSEMRNAKKETSRLATEVDDLESELDKKPAKVDQKDYTEGGGAKPRKLAKGD